MPEMIVTVQTPCYSEYTISIGDEVVVYDWSGDRPQKGTVAKIGPKLIHIDRGYVTQAFRRDDQAANARNHTGYFQARKQVLDRDTQDTAVSLLREHGVNVERNKFTLDELMKLVAFVTELKSDEADA